MSAIGPPTVFSSVFAAAINKSQLDTLEYQIFAVSNKADSSNMIVLPGNRSSLKRFQKALARNTRAFRILYTYE